MFVHFSLTCLVWATFTSFLSFWISWAVYLNEVGGKNTYKSLASAS